MSVETRRNFVINVLEGVAFVAGMAFLSQQAMLPLFVSRHTDWQWLIGSIPGLFIICLNLPLLAGAAHMSKVRNFQATIRFQFLIPRLALFLLAAVPWLPGSWVLPGFFVAWALFGLTVGFQLPLWYEFVGHVIPAESRGRFFGYHTLLGGLCSLMAAGLAARLLEHLPEPWGFRACFAIGALLCYLSYLGLMASRHDFSQADRHRTEAPPFWPSAQALWRENRLFRRYVLTRLVLSAPSMAMAFYIVYGQERFKLTLAEGSLLAIVLMYLPALVGLSCGQLADRFGNRMPQIASALLASAGNLLIVLVSDYHAFLAGLFLSGCATTVVAMLDSKWLLDLDETRRGAVVAFFHLCQAPVTGLLPIAAGVLAQNHGKEPLFVMSAMAWAIGAWLFWRYMK